MILNLKLKVEYFVHNSCTVYNTIMDTVEYISIIISNSFGLVQYSSCVTVYRKLSDYMTMHGALCTLCSMEAIHIKGKTVTLYAILYYC